MSDVLIDMAMIEAVTNVIPSAFLAVNISGRISHAYISRQSPNVLQRLIGKKFHWGINRVFHSTTADTVLEYYEKCLQSKQPVEIAKLKHIDSHGLLEYLNWQFLFVLSCNSVVIYVRNITESVLIEEEFTDISEQYESVNRELYEAMSKLDLHLMDIEQAHKKIAALYRVTSIVQKTVNEQEVLEGILDGINRELGFNDVAIMLLDESGKALKVTAYRGCQDMSIRIPLGTGIAGHSVLSRELIYVDDVSRDTQYNMMDEPANGNSEVAVPLIVGDKVLGVLDIRTENARTLQPYDLDLLRSLASHIAMTIDHANHVSYIEKQAITDGLTNLYNHCHFRTVLAQEIKRANRYNRPLAMLMIDIDYFKHYNDTNGHLMGDEALATVAALIKQSCRDVDVVARYGGEEFSILLPETTVEEAKVIAERIRLSVEAHTFPNEITQPNGKLTISIGAAEYPKNAKSLVELIDYADMALYHAKSSNRNCISIYHSS